MNQRPSADESIIEPTQKHNKNTPIDTRMVDIRKFALEQAVEFSKAPRMHNFTIVDVASEFEKYIVNGVDKND